MKNLLYLLFVMPLFFSCGEGEVEEEKQEFVYVAECCEYPFQWEKFKKKIKGANGKWRCKDLITFEVDKKYFDEVEKWISQENKKKIKDINGKEYNLYIKTIAMVDKDYYKRKYK